jgi:hypothetical protein
LSSARIAPSAHLDIARLGIACRLAAPTRLSMDSSDGYNTSMICAVGSALSIAAG